ncbi:uncharacterized protein LOC110844777 [Folsomia candida]|uniref:Pro-resilin n=1 Tax=Folsomia candida TaxID=158441 RepID=A0A226EQ85_FOLCA|nr:uncharacterized protein LOC110844777 [Folsomia candida]OXA59214.1 Pro-resilin [Folsomia candida]
MEPKDFLVYSCLLLLSNGLDSVVSVPYPEYYDGHHGGGHNAIVDYYSRPKYAFGYEVDGLDEYFKELSHGRWEIRDGDVVQGQYRVLLPDGRIQIVSYIADRFGYRPTIKYINKGVLPPPPPAYAHVKTPEFYPVEEPLPPPIPLVEHVNPYEHATYGAGYGYGFDPFVALGSTNSNSRVGKRRSLPTSKLSYDRTLFRKDVERKRRSGGTAARKVSPRPSPSPSPTTVTLVSSPAGTKRQRRVTLTPASAYNTK